MSEIVGDVDIERELVRRRLLAARDTGPPLLLRATQALKAEACAVDLVVSDVFVGADAQRIVLGQTGHSHRRARGRADAVEAV